MPGDLVETLVCSTGHKDETLHANAARLRCIVALLLKPLAGEAVLFSFKRLRSYHLRDVQGGELLCGVPGATFVVRKTR